MAQVDLTETVLFRMYTHYKIFCNHEELYRLMIRPVGGGGLRGATSLGPGSIWVQEKWREPEAKNIDI